MQDTCTPTHVKHYRWAILTVMSVTLGVQTGVRVAFSVFYVALRQEFGWSAAATAGVFSLYMGVLAVSSPLVGWPRVLIHASKRAGAHERGKAAERQRSVAHFVCIV